MQSRPRKVRSWRETPLVCMEKLNSPGCCPLVAGPVMGGPQRAELWLITAYMTCPQENRAAGVGFEERLVIVAAVDAGVEPQSVTGGGRDERRMHSRRAPINGGHTGVLDSSESSRSAGGGRSKQRPSSTSLCTPAEQLVAFRAQSARAVATRMSNSSQTHAKHMVP